MSDTESINKQIEDDMTKLRESVSNLRSTVSEHLNEMPMEVVVALDKFATGVQDEVAKIIFNYKSDEALYEKENQKLRRKNVQMKLAFAELDKAAKRFSQLAN